MLQNINPNKKDLVLLAGVLNQFKSEAVQVRLLELLLQGTATASTTTEAVAESTQPRRRGRPLKAVVAAEKTPKPAKTGRKGRSKVGATTALYKLIESGFFKAHRSIADVTAACKSKLGLDIAVTNLSGPLMRLVGEKKLARAKNKNDKFEYWAK